MFTLIFQPLNRYFPQWRWLPLILWAMAIFYVSHQPKAAIPQLPPPADYQPAWIDVQLAKINLDRDSFVKKTAHGVAFAIFAGLAYVATGSLWGAFLMGAAYAGFDELHQAFVPSRTARWTDVVIDGVGVLVGNAGIYWLKK